MSLNPFQLLTIQFLFKQLKNITKQMHEKKRLSYKDCKLLKILTKI